jgi:hypothetical protein
MTTDWACHPVTGLATFARIGRNHDVAPLAISGDADQIAEQVYRYALPKLASKDVEVVVDLNKMTGHIYFGIQVGGSFTITRSDQ